MKRSSEVDGLEEGKIKGKGAEKEFSGTVQDTKHIITFNTQNNPMCKILSPF